MGQERGARVRPTQAGVPGDHGQSEAGPSGRDLLLQFLDRGHAFKLIALLLVFSVVPLGEVFLFIYIGHLIGNFLVLALTVIAGAAGALAAVDQLGRCVARLRTRLEAGIYPGPELADLAGVLAGAILLLTPGFITDICGYALMLRGVRRAAGTLLDRALGPGLRDVLQRLAASQSLKMR